MNRRSKPLISALSQKCPQCQKGNVFTYSPFSFRFYQTNDHCPNCGLRFEKEPGFFYGAMYFSYALNVAIIVTTGLSINYFIYPSIMQLVAWTACIALLMVPLTFRYSRILMLYVFGNVEYKPELK